jgi:hypothetical protein
MKTFAVVAVRLIGMWLIAGALPLLTFFAADFFEQRAPLEQGSVADVIRQIATATPVVAGIILLALSRPIGLLLSAGVADDSPAPESLTVRGFTQVGAFLLGLFAILNGIPSVVGMAVGGYGAQVQHWIYVVLGVVLVLSCVQLGKLFDALRR